MLHKTIKVRKTDIKKLPEPKFQEISFEGNMPSTYEKNFKKALAKKAKRRK